MSSITETFTPTPIQIKPTPASTLKIKPPLNNQGLLLGNNHRIQPYRLHLKELRPLTPVSADLGLGRFNHECLGASEPREHSPEACLDCSLPACLIAAEGIDFNKVH